MAILSDKTSRKVEQRRRLTLFFNKGARHSAASALKKASWLMAAANAYLGVHQGSLAYMAVLVIGWLITQAVAVVLLSIEEKGGSQEPKEQQHGSNPEGRRRRAHT
jgi:hypothetical protein